MSSSQPSPTTTVPHGVVVPVDVHFDDLDAMGVLHNARYAVLVERALSSYWTSQGLGFGGRLTEDAFSVVREFTISYLAPVTGPGRLGVHLWIEKLGRTSVRYGFRVLSEDGSVVHAEGRRGQVKLDPQTWRPRPWTDRVREAAAPLLSRELATAGESR
ncbi:MAG TPA: thioesterase family protein [Pseudonocardiaceae bacterium]